VDLLSQALDRLAAGERKAYLDENSDRAAATHYYAELDLDEDGALARLLEATHGVQPRYSPATELYPWVDLQTDRKVRSIYTQ
jgi:hypothetical protein